jgi:hypothetical protein
MIKRWEWFLLLLLAAGGVLLWGRIALPRYQSIDLSINQFQALGIADRFLKDQRHFSVDGYKTAVSFNVDEDTDRYLQKTLGTKDSRQLLHKLNFDLFFWVVRYFKEKQKEEFKVVVSSATGQVIAFSHVIADTAMRPAMNEAQARHMALDFLKTSYGFDPARFVLHSNETKKHENREDYLFSWQEKDVNIPWNKGADKGNAHVLTTVTISGGDILMFAKYQFEVPDGFNRYVDNLKQTGQNLTLVFRMLYLALLTIAIVVVVNRKQQVVARGVKPFYIVIGIGIFLLMVFDLFNSYESILFDYPTTQSLGDYIVRQLIEGIIAPFFVAVAFILPALAGESLRFEVAPGQKQRAFLSILQSSFWSVRVAHQLLAGYLAAAIILGVQAVIYDFGFKYCGVWDELSWLTQASTSVVPAFTALTIGFQAAFAEEAMFRMFAINLLKKYGVPTAIAVFMSAAAWGFGHTGYEVFPMWFRGLEVTGIGIIMGVFYLRYGLVCVIAAHFLIDAGLTSLPYFLNPHGGSFDFYSSLAVLSLPFWLAVMGLIFDKHVEEKPLSVRFNAQQQFNYDLLRELYSRRKPEELAAFRKDLERHGWDHVLIQRVFDGE